VSLSPGMLRVTLASVGAVSVVSVEGELDMATTDRLADVLEGLQLAGGDIAIDVSALEFIDSTGLQQIVAADQRARTRGCSLLLVGAGGACLRALELSGIAEHLALLPTLDALAARTAAGDRDGDGALNGRVRLDAERLTP
jgi:anti-sigma B factor antagonist